MTQPILLVTRRLPSAVEARAVRDYDARLNPDDVPRSGADIVRLAEGAAAILCCPAERVDAGTQLMGTQVSGKRLGIFGMGRIGRELARLARAFEMPVHYRDQRRLPPALEQGAIFHDTDESFLPTCEVLSLNAPGDDSTRHWLNAQRIALLPKGAVVVNAARGTLVDDSALIAALQSGRLGYAGLDVYDGEPNLNPAYLGLENVVLLPHLGSATVETRNAMGFLALDGIDAVLAGRTPPNLVT